VRSSDPPAPSDVSVALGHPMIHACFTPAAWETGEPSCPTTAGATPVHRFTPDLTHASREHPLPGSTTPGPDPGDAPHRALLRSGGSRGPCPAPLLSPPHHLTLRGSRTVWGLTPSPAAAAGVDDRPAGPRRLGGAGAGPAGPHLRRRPPPPRGDGLPVLLLLLRRPPQDPRPVGAAAPAAGGVGGPGKRRVGLRRRGDEQRGRAGVRGGGGGAGVVVVRRRGRVRGRRVRLGRR
jgi:hypothetical protein